MTNRLIGRCATKGLSFMSARGAIPPIIKEALDSRPGYILIVTGKPGTGKSLFVREVFREYEDSFLILSNAEATSVDNLSDLPEWPSRHAVAQYWREVAETPLYEMSLDRQIHTLLNSKDVSKESNIIIIDSWNDFVMPVDNRQKYAIQQSLIYAARNERKKLLLVIEGDEEVPNQESIHYSADAIIQFEKLQENQRMIRQMSIQKMRYHPINQDTFLFTLENGRFSFIPWYKHQFPPITVERETIDDPSKNKISTGNKSLDRILSGGFEKGMLSLFEVENLAAPYLETLYIPFLSNHLQLNRPAVILLPEGWSPDRFIRGLSHFVGGSRIEKQVVFFGRHALGTRENVRSIDDDPWKTLQEIRYEATQLEREFETEATELFALDTLENKYGVNDVKGMMAEITASLPLTNRATVAILSQHQELKSGSIAYGIHLRVKELSGVLSVFGVIPRTHFLTIHPLLSKGFLDYDLIPIV
jgi:KaiC/GvpD/RAD55 family RecA-like ATPase